MNYAYRAFCPYRICPLGAHIDHQYGVVTGFAIDRGISVEYNVTSDGSVRLTSENIGGSVSFRLNSTLTRQNDWGDYIRGVTVELARRHTLNFGIVGRVSGTLPIGGLSSSAALSISYLSALCHANGISPDESEVILTAKAAENGFVGVNCGKLDQSSEVYSRKGHLLYLDNLDDSHELIPQPDSMKPYDIAIIFSGVERALKGSGYNARQDECKAAAYALAAYAGLPAGSFGDARLRHIPIELFHRYGDRLPDAWRKRAEHYYSEFDRTVRGAEAFRRGDLDGFGKLMFESGESSIYNYESGSPELISIFNSMKKTDGIYGGRFSGAGFKGCLLAFTDPSMREEITAKLKADYAAEFPELADKFAVFFCNSADGCKF